MENFESLEVCSGEKGIQYNQERDITGVSMKGERAVGRWFCKEMRWKRWVATNTLGLQC